MLGDVSKVGSNSGSTDWVTVEIQALGQIYGGGTPSRNISAFWNGSIPWVTPTDVTRLNKKLLVQTQEYITQRGLMSSAAKLLPAGALLVTTRATIGAVAMAGIPLCTNQGFKSLVPEPGIDPNFYFHVFRTLTPELLRRSSGSTFLEISGSQFAKICVPLPPLPEQRRIADILDTADAAIQQTDALIAKLKLIRTGLLHDLLTRGLDEHGHLRDPISHPDQFKNSALGTVPKTWQALRLSALVQYISYGFTNPMPSTSEGPWMITAFDIADGRIRYHQARHTTPSAYRALTAKSKPQIGDILVTKDGTLGRIAVVDEPNICINQSVACLRPLLDTDTRFLVHYLRSPRAQERMLADAGGSTIKHIYITKLGQLQVPLPSHRERQASSDVIDAHDARIRAEEAYRDKLKRIKQGLMDDLLTGRVRVPVAEGATA